MCVCHVNWFVVWLRVIVMSGEEGCWLVAVGRRVCALVFIVEKFVASMMSVRRSPLLSWRVECHVLECAFASIRMICVLRRSW